MMKHVLAVFVLVLMTSPALAQTGVPTSYVLKVYATGAPTATTTLTVTSAQVACNQARPTTAGSAENPDVWRWNDIAITGRDCVVTDSTRFDALPDGSYEGTVAAVNADGSSAETARIPFTRRRPNPPAVPTGLRIGQ